MLSLSLYLGLVRARARTPMYHPFSRQLSLKITCFVCYIGGENMDEVTAPAKTDEPERSWWCTARRWKTADTWCARRRLTATVRAENADRRHARGRIEADAQGPP